MDKKKVKKFFLHVVLALALASVFHEFAHAIVGSLFGWEILGFHFYPFLRYVILQPRTTPSIMERIFVYSAGAIANFIVYACLINELKYDEGLFWDKDRHLIYGGFIWSIIYGIFETVVLGIFQWRLF